MKIIAFLNPKGGSGKTTATINVSSCLASSGKKIAVVDTDPQMSLTNWNKAEKAAFDVYTAASEKDVYQVRKDLAEYDFCQYALLHGSAHRSQNNLPEKMPLYLLLDKKIHSVINIKTHGIFLLSDRKSVV